MIKLRNYTISLFLLFNILSLQGWAETPTQPESASQRSGLSQAYDQHPSPGQVSSIAPEPGQTRSIRNKGKKKFGPGGMALVGLGVAVIGGVAWFGGTLLGMSMLLAPGILLAFIGIGLAIVGFIVWIVNKRMYRYGRRGKVRKSNKKAKKAFDFEE